MAEKTKLTKAGLKKLQDELDTLVQVTREQVKHQLAEARAQGDLSENADYDAARARQTEVEGRIKEIEDILGNYELIDESSKNASKVGLGSTVTVKYLDLDQEKTFMIVGSVETDPLHGKISNASPLGAALMNKTLGDVLDVKGPTKSYKVEIVKIEIK